MGYLVFVAWWCGVDAFGRASLASLGVTVATRTTNVLWLVGVFIHKGFRNLWCGRPLCFIKSLLVFLFNKAPNTGRTIIKKLALYVI